MATAILDEKSLVGEIDFSSIENTRKRNERKTGPLTAQFQSGQMKRC
jgi:hypothetical protein